MTILRSNHQNHKHMLEESVIKKDSTQLIYYLPTNIVIPVCSTNQFQFTICDNKMNIFLSPYLSYTNIYKSKFSYGRNHVFLLGKNGDTLLATRDTIFYYTFYFVLYFQFTLHQSLQESLPFFSLFIFPCVYLAFIRKFHFHNLYKVIFRFCLIPLTLHYLPLMIT